MDGRRCELLEDPLSSYLDQNNLRSLLNKDIMDGVSSACWRGYRGKWQIHNGKLYLTELRSPLGRKIALSRLFPASHLVERRTPLGKILALARLFPASYRVALASWYSGPLTAECSTEDCRRELRFEQGELIGDVRVPKEAINRKQRTNPTAQQSNTPPTPKPQSNAPPTSKQESLRGHLVKVLVWLLYCGFATAVIFMFMFPKYTFVYLKRAVEYLIGF